MGNLPYHFAMFVRMRRKWTRLLFLAIGSACLTTAHAAEWPSKPIRFLVGPGPDILARLLGQKFTDAWGQQVIVDQRPGAGGAIAVEGTASAAPDGHTLLLSTGSVVISVRLFVKSEFDAVRDLAPGGLVATVPFVFVVHPSLPVKTVGDLIQLARRRPGQMNYGSAGAGTAGHLCGEMLTRISGVKIVHVPYKSLAIAATDVLGGQIEMIFLAAQAAIPHVRAGKLRGLAVSSSQRARSIPELPTVAEAGVQGFEFVSWNGLSFPKGTPDSVITKVNSTMAKAVADAAMRDQLIALGLEPAPSTPTEFGRYAEGYLAKWSKVIREAGIATLR